MATYTPDGLLVVRVGSVNFAIPSQEVDGTLNLPSNRTLSHAGNGFEHEGRLFRVVDLREKLALPLEGRTGQIVFGRAAGQPVGLVVDEVLGNLNSDEAVPLTLPPGLPRHSFSAALRVQGQITLRTGLTQLVALKDLTALQQLARTDSDNSEPSPTRSDGTHVPLDQTLARAAAALAKSAHRHPTQSPATAPPKGPENTSSKRHAKPRSPESAPISPRSAAKATPEHDGSAASIAAEQSASVAPSDHSAEKPNPLPGIPAASASPRKHPAPSVTPPNSAAIQPPSSGGPTMSPSKPAARPVPGEPDSSISAARLALNSPPATPEDGPSSVSPKTLLIGSVRKLLTRYRSSRGPAEQVPSRFFGDPARPETLREMGRAWGLVALALAGLVGLAVGLRELGEPEPTVTPSAKASQSAQAASKQEPLPPPSEARVKTQKTASASERADDRATKQALEKPVRKGKEIVYTVVEGDTLWAIANQYVKNPWAYHDLATHSGIANPDLIEPGDQVHIVLRDKSAPPAKR